MASLLSKIARGTVRGAVRLYYPKMEFSDRERLPAKGPVLIVANHANSLMDPVVLGIAAKRPVHFLAKAPLFEIPIFGNVLKALGMIPAYRASDDSSQMHKNVKSLSDAARWLVEGDAVGIFPEGKSHDLYHVEQVRTGAARIAVQALEMGGAELKIVPVGINYERKERFGSAVWVRVGEWIEVKSWAAIHPEQESKQTVRALTHEIDLRLQDLVVHLHETKWEPFLSELEILRPPPNASSSMARLRQRKRLADAINHFLVHDASRTEAAASLIEQHRTRISEAGLSMESPLLRWQGTRLAFELAGRFLLLMVGLPIAAAGTLHHLVPFVITRLIVAKAQPPGRTAVALWRLLIGLPIYGVWYGFVWWGMNERFGAVVATLWLVAMPFAGTFALYYWGRAMDFAAAAGHLIAKGSELDKLRREQEKLCTLLSEMAADYAKKSLEQPLR